MSHGVGRFSFLSGLFRVGGNPEGEPSYGRIFGGIGVVSLTVGGIFLFLRWNKTPSRPSASVTFELSNEEERVGAVFQKNLLADLSPHSAPYLDRRDVVVHADDRQSTSPPPDRKDAQPVHVSSQHQPSSSSPPLLSKKPEKSARVLEEERKKVTSSDDDELSSPRSPTTTPPTSPPSSPFSPPDQPNRVDFRAAATDHSSPNRPPCKTSSI